ncbi:MAG: hypothetical protein NUW01_18190 [Gemmatimonadaceae bacterium]|nr:hypothetical protein [Gemmatimonadaceae bacterium]
MADISPAIDSGSPTFAGWPPITPYPESERDSRGVEIPDFPDTAGGREQGKFRPGGLPGETRVAVTVEDNPPTTESLLAELLLYQKATVLGLSKLTDIDLLAAVS